MLSICGVDCCSECPRQTECGGCIKTDGRPFGGTCVAAERIRRGGFDAFHALKKELIDEINSLGILHLHVDGLNLLNGFYVNLAYPLPDKSSVKFLEDNRIYFGNQIEIPGSDRCLGVVADTDMLLVCSYGCNGSDPELLLYKKRDSRQ